MSPQRNFSPAPVGNPVAPSSVTSGDSFPPRGSLRRWYTPATKCLLTQTLLPQNANPNQGTQMGPEIAPPSGQCTTTAKTSEWERAAPKPGGAGGIPPRLFASGLSLEKAWIPARDRAGRTTPQVLTCGGSKGDHPPTAETARPAPPGAAHRKENPYPALRRAHQFELWPQAAAGGRHPLPQRGG